MISITVLEDHLDNMFKALKEASRLLTEDDKYVSLAARLGDAVSQLNTANHHVYGIHRDGGTVNDLLETLVTSSYRQATVELAELREGRTPKVDVVRPLVNVALRVATDELIIVRAATTPDAKRENKETAPEDKSGAETPLMREEVYAPLVKNILEMEPTKFKSYLQKAYEFIRSSYPLHVFGSTAGDSYDLYLSNFEYGVLQWALNYSFNGKPLFPLAISRPHLFDSEESADLERIAKELDTGLPTLPRLKQMWVHVVNTRDYQRYYHGDAKTLAIKIQALIKYEESMQPDTAYWVGESSCSATDAAFLVVTEARRQAEKSVDGIGACIMRQKSGESWTLTTAAINKKTNKMVKKIFTVKNSNLYEAVITLVNMARLEVENG